MTSHQQMTRMQLTCVCDAEGDGEDEVGAVVDFVAAGEDGALDEGVVGALAGSGAWA